MMDKTLEVKFHFKCTVPVFKSKHGAPVQPEGGIKHLIVKYIFNSLIVEILIFGHEQLHDFHTAFLAQIELAVCMCILSTVHSCTAERVVRIMLIQPVEFIQNGSTRFLKGRNTVEKIPQTFKMVLHLTAAAHNVAS